MLFPRPFSAREPENGPFLSPAQYKSGDGDIAVCVHPVYGGNFAAAIIPEWAEFQKMMGVSKVCARPRAWGAGSGGNREGPCLEVVREGGVHTVVHEPQGV